MLTYIIHAIRNARLSCAFLILGVIGSIIDVAESNSNLFFFVKISYKLLTLQR